MRCSSEKNDLEGNLRISLIAPRSKKFGRKYPTVPDESCGSIFSVMKE
jgi:hypothetical protein